MSHSQAIEGLSAFAECDRLLEQGTRVQTWIIRSRKVHEREVQKLQEEICYSQLERQHAREVDLWGDLEFISQPRPDGDWKELYTDSEICNRKCRFEIAASKSIVRNAIHRARIELKREDLLPILHRAARYLLTKEAFVESGQIWHGLVEKNGIIHTKPVHAIHRSARRQIEFLMEEQESS